MLGAGPGEAKGQNVGARRGPSQWPAPSLRQVTFLLSGPTTVLRKEPSEPRVAAAEAPPCEAPHLTPHLQAPAP